VIPFGWWNTLILLDFWLRALNLLAINLLCPYCGHDGTRETGRSSLGSHGFNYLAEGLVSRVVTGYDDAGSLKVSGEYVWQPVSGAGDRLECRSCWRTFPVPADVQRPTAVNAPLPPREGPGLAHDETPPGRPPFRETEIQAKLDELRERIDLQQHDAKQRADALEAGYREVAQARNWLGDVVARLEVEQQATKRRLDAQADVIRGLHAAVQEQTGQREELRNAVQRLEEIVRRLSDIGPVPKDL
jgi:hypothetical protein